MKKLKRKHCPHCMYTYEVITGDPREDISQRYGCVIRTCERCNQQYIDHEKNEIAITGIQPTDTMLLHPIMTPIAILSLIVSVVSWISLFQNTETTTSMTWLIAWTLIGLTFTYNTIYRLITSKKRIVQLKAELRNSKLRLSVPEYAKFLYDQGVYVPHEYLISNNSNSTIATNSGEIAKNMALFGCDLSNIGALPQCRIDQE